MARRGPRRGLGAIEVFVLLLIFAALLAMVVVGVAYQREAARRTQCHNNLKQIGLGLQNFASANNGKFPGSAELIGTGGTPTVGGYGFLVKILGSCQSHYDSLMTDQARFMQPDDANNQNGRRALQQSITEYVCPSFRGVPFADPENKEGALTNYKAMGATHIESLQSEVSPSVVPRYPDRTKHPDGGLYPDSDGIRLTDFTDGTSHTILLAETVEPRFARWTVGKEMTIVGLPPTVEFAKHEGYYAPAGFDGRFGPETSVATTYKTYLNWDYDANPYDGADGSQYGRYGPSSRHARIVNHAFADGSVHSLRKTIDAAAYMFLITRAGGDPFPASECP